MSLAIFRTPTTDRADPCFCKVIFKSMLFLSDNVDRLEWEPFREGLFTYPNSRAGLMDRSNMNPIQSSDSVQKRRSRSLRLEQLEQTGVVVFQPTEAVRTQMHPL